MEYLSIPHYRGLKEKYDEQKHGDGIFFTTDTHEIIANNATYGETIDTWSITDGVLTLTMVSGKTLDITFDEATESAKGFLSAEDKKKINSLDGNLDKKVDKVAGKSLTSNDFTDTLKTKLDGIAENANNYSLPTASETELGGVMVDSALSSTSTNPVQNRAIGSAIDEINSKLSWAKID